MWRLCKIDVDNGTNGALFEAFNFFLWAHFRNDISRSHSSSTVPSRMQDICHGCFFFNHEFWLIESRFLEIEREWWNGFICTVVGNEIRLWLIIYKSRLKNLFLISTWCIYAYHLWCSYIFQFPLLWHLPGLWHTRLMVSE